VIAVLAVSEPGAAVEGFRRQLAAFGPADAEDSGLHVQELIGEGHHVVARLRIFTRADGLITEIRAVSDRLGMFPQLGWDRPSAG
jgi:hypothetical protein